MVVPWRVGEVGGGVAWPRADGRRNYPVLTYDPHRRSSLGREGRVPNVGQLLQQEAEAVDERADDRDDDPEHVRLHHRLAGASRGHA